MKATQENQIVLLTPTRLGVPRELPKGSKRKFSVPLLQNEHHFCAFFCDDKKTAEALIGQQIAVIAVERTFKERDSAGKETGKDITGLRWEYYSAWSAYVTDQKTSMAATDEIVKATLLNDLQLDLVKAQAKNASVSSAANIAAGL